MLNATNYPEWFGDLMDKAAKAMSLPINREIVQIFWEHIKKYSVDKNAIAKALDSVVEEGAFLKPSEVIQRLPRHYPEQMGWPEWEEVKDVTESGIGQDCIALIEAKLNEDIDKQAFHQGMLDLSKKYPSAGFSAVAKRYEKSRSFNKEI